MSSAAHESQPSLTAGAVVDHYKVTRLIGRGGMGEVYLAHDTKLGRKVALKVVRPDALGDQQAVEARATAQFNHPNVVTIYGVGGRRVATGRCRVARCVRAAAAGCGYWAAVAASPTSAATPQS